jgi:hypothetical protein
MSYNGSGTFNINTAGQPVVTGTSIDPTVFNNLTADLASGLSTAICKDGQTVVTANIPMASYKITGLGAATARTDAASLANIQDGTGVYVATVGGTADVITLTPSPAIAAYAAGQTFRFIAAGANTTNVTVNVSGLGAKALTKNGTTALIADDIAAGDMVECTYDGTRFILDAVNLSVSAFARTVLDDANAAAVRTTIGALGSSENAVGVAAGAITGAMLNNSVVNDLTTVTIASGDYVAIADVSDSNNKKKALVSDIMALASTIPPQGALWGMTLSNNGADATNDIDVAAGSCASTHATPSSVVLLNPGAMTKRLDASWAAGTNQGGLSSSLTIANTTYHVFAIRVGGVDDIGFDTSPVAANLIADHSATHYRRIGSILRESAAIVPFTQFADRFLRTTPVLDVSATNPGTSAVTRTVSIPTGIQCVAMVNAATAQSGTNSMVYLSPLSSTDSAPSATLAPLYSFFGSNVSTAQWGVGMFSILTNTSAQFRSRLSASDANTVLYIATLGWIDPLGRNA